MLHLKYTKHLKAGDGGSGGKSLSTGANGKDIIVEVPLGTIVKDPETMEQLAEITEDGDRKPPQGLLDALTEAIVFEDPRLMALNKPSGLASHGGSGIN